MIGEVQLGELLCDSLVEAEDAPLLQIAVSANEVTSRSHGSASIRTGLVVNGIAAARDLTTPLFDRMNQNLVGFASFPRGASNWPNLLLYKSFP